MQPLMSLKTPRFNILNKTMRVLGSIAWQIIMNIQNLKSLQRKNSQKYEVYPCFDFSRGHVNKRCKLSVDTLTCSTVARSAFSVVLVLPIAIPRTLSRIAVVTEFDMPLSHLPSHSYITNINIITFTTT